jgi:hypothetical protein
MVNVFDKLKTYRTFLVTSWQERSQDPDLSPVWRFAWGAHTDQWRAFATLEGLVDALKQELSEAADQ